MDRKTEGRLTLYNYVGFTEWCLEDDWIFVIGQIYPRIDLDIENFDYAAVTECVAKASGFDIVIDFGDFGSDGPTVLYWSVIIS